MSLLSSEVRALAIHESGLDLLTVRREGWLRPSWHPVSHQSLPCVAGVTPERPRWHDSVARIADLERASERKKTPIQLVLSNHYIRYLQLSWEQVVASRGKVETLAKAYFEVNFGDIATQWRINVQPPRPGAPCLAAAIDEPLVSALTAQLADKGYQVAGMQPLVTASMASCLKQPGIKPARNDYFAIFEPGRLTVLGRVGIYNLRLNSDDALLPTLEQCLAATPSTDAGRHRVFLCAPTWKPTGALPDHVQWIDHQPLTPSGTRSSIGHFMAACAIFR